MSICGGKYDSTVRRPYPVIRYVDPFDLPSFITQDFSLPRGIFVPEHRNKLYSYSTTTRHFTSEAVQ
jgi:hypothetical protein